MSAILALIKKPASKRERYCRWVSIGWSPIPYTGKDHLEPDQKRFRLKLRVHRQRGAEVDAWAETGEAVDGLAHRVPHMEVFLHILFDPDRIPTCYYDVAAVLHQTVRHEIEHLLDEGLLARGGPTTRRRQQRMPGQERWQRSIRLQHWHRVRAKLFTRGKMTPRKWKKVERRLAAANLLPTCSTLDYMVSAKELHPFVKGFQAEARYRKVPWDTPMHEYVDSMWESGKMTKDEAEAAKTMLVQWAVRVLPSAPITDETLARYL